MNVLGKASNIILILLGMILLTGHEVVYGQKAEQQIAFELENKSLDEGLQALGKVSGFKMAYSSQLVTKYKRISVKKGVRSVKETLDLLLKDTDLEGIIQATRILIVEKQQVKENLLPGQFLLQGVVTDLRAIPLSGVSIGIKAENRGSVTDINGRFSIKVKSGQMLGFSCLGYKNKEMLVTVNTLLEVVMEESENKLSEVVVLGYGNTLRKDLTGSISTVNTNELLTVPAMSLDDALAGKAAGVAITKADGSPGGAVRIRVRGGSSLAGSTDPLYVIDGIPIDVTNNYQSVSEIVNPMEASNYGDDFNSSISGAFSRGLNNLAGLDLNDVESIDILKDASATAIYGSKAANGVVIITTKKGRKESAPRINLDYFFGVNKPIADKALNAEQYKSALLQAAQNTIDNLNKNAAGLTAAQQVMFNSFSNSARTNAQKVLDNAGQWGNADTDWLDLVLRTGNSHNIHFSLNGGSQNSRYYASTSYTRQDGTLISTDFERISGKINLDTDISNRLRLLTNLNYGYIKNNITNGLYTQALYAPPVFEPYNPDGTYATFGDLSTSYMGFQNPLAVATSTNRATTYLLKGTIGLEFDILRDLRFKSTASVDYNSYNQVNYVPSYVKIGGFYGAEDSGGGTGSEAQSLSINTFFENTLTYEKVFNSAHRFNVLLGTSWENKKMNYFKASGKGYPDDNILTGLSSAAQPTSVAGASPWLSSSLLSFYIRANYYYQDKYLFTFTGRSDASSKFAPDNRVGYFPSGAIAWRISQEAFLSDVSWIDDLKIRASAGKTGTQNIDDNMWRTLYTPDSYAGKNALYPSQLGNSEIKWESTVQKDLGLDFSFMNGRLGGTFGYYHKITDGALLNITPAPSSGFSTVVYNIAKIRNVGIELDLYGYFVRNKDFSWRGALNLAQNKSKVLNILGERFSDASDRAALNLGNSIVKEGESLGLLCGYKSVGIIRDEEQLQSYLSRFPATAAYAIWWALFPAVGVGSLEYAQNETGMYYQDVIGNASPDFFGGYTNTLTYKHFSLLTHFTFSYGNELIYLNDVSDMAMSYTLKNRTTHLLGDNPNLSERPANIYTGMIIFLTDQNVYDASYLKLKTLSLSYNVPQKFLKPLHASELQVYATAGNLFTLTKYPGLDPEVSDAPGSVIGGGRDISSYPTSKSYTFGVRINF